MTLVSTTQVQELKPSKSFLSIGLGRVWPVQILSFGRILVRLVTVFTRILFWGVVEVCSVSSRARVHRC